jgi:hypothetical protein
MTWLMRYGQPFLGVFLVGCAHNDATPIAAEPQPRMSDFHKENGTGDDFQRAKIHCYLQAETTIANSPRPFLMVWDVAFQACMQDNGWMKNEPR